MYSTVQRQLYKSKRGTRERLAWYTRGTHRVHARYTHVVTIAIRTSVRKKCTLARTVMCHAHEIEIFTRPELELRVLSSSFVSVSRHKATARRQHASVEHYSSSSRHSAPREQLQACHDTKASPRTRSYLLQADSSFSGQEASGDGKGRRLAKSAGSILRGFQSSTTASSTMSSRPMTKQLPESCGIYLFNVS